MRELLFQKGDLKCFVSPDEDCASPRENSNPSVMVCFHPHYILGDKTPFRDPDHFREWWKETLRSHKRRGCFILPLFLHDHSGLRMSTRGFADPWDSGQVGWIYSTPYTREGCGTPSRFAKEVMQEEVEEYDRYISGDCWKYEIVRVKKCNEGYTHEEHVDSCAGFIGREWAEKEAKEAFDAVDG